MKGAAFSFFLSSATPTQHSSVQPGTIIMAEVEKQQDEKRPEAALVTEESGGDAIFGEDKSNGPPATKREVWSYYAYFAANNGLGSFQ